MDARKIILLVGALVVAGLTAFMARTMMAGSATPEAGAMVASATIDGPEVLVATRALPIGTILDATALKFQPWPKDLVENAYYIQRADRPEEPDGHGRPQRDYRWPAGHAGRAGQARRPRLPGRGARTRHARGHGTGIDADIASRASSSRVTAST